jgi:Dullard-like phosphatase family protein
MVIINNSPNAYCFQPRNAIPILSWFDDPNDDELLKLIPLLQQLATEESVYPSWTCTTRICSRGIERKHHFLAFSANSKRRVQVLSDRYLPSPNLLKVSVRNMYPVPRGSCFRFRSLFHSGLALANNRNPTTSEKKPKQQQPLTIRMRIESGSGASELIYRRRSSAPNVTVFHLHRTSSGGYIALDIVPSKQSPSAKALANGPSTPPLPPKTPPRAESGQPINTNSHQNETPHGASANGLKRIVVEHDTSSTQIESGNAGKELPVSIMVPNSYGLKVKARYLTKVQAKKKNASPFHCENFLPMLKRCPKPKEGKITLALDIDETLVHASINPRPGLRYHTIAHIDDGPNSGDIYVAFRPHLHTFLRAVAPLFEVVVFTASQSCYADPLMDTIDPDKTLVTDRLYREHCVELQEDRVKDLNLCGRSLDRMVIIDNSPIAYCFQPRNAIPILSWFDDPNDDELLKLIPVLQQLAFEETVYPFLDMYNAHLLSRD